MKKKIIKPTPFGSVAVIWSRFDGSPRIVRVLLSTRELSAEDQVPKIYPDSHASSCAEIDAVATAIKAFLKGENVVFPLDIVNLKPCPAFQKAVLRAEHQIPWGSVSTYQLIAGHLGKENGARAVGNALANNPFPLIVPCHRAIRSDGHLGGFQGGLDMKRALLRKEGIVFDDAGRVVRTRFHYERKYRIR
jgi:methylated-DNA-[protein]-cysteine S-methyltransferase